MYKMTHLNLSTDNYYLLFLKICHSIFLITVKNKNNNQFILSNKLNLLAIYYNIKNITG